MSWESDLATPLARVRFAAGDTGTPPLLPGGDETYEALIAAFPADEAGAWRAACSALATYYATQPTSISSSGESLSWGARVARWQYCASGGESYPFADDAAASGSGSTYSGIDYSW